MFGGEEEVNFLTKKNKPVRSSWQDKVRSGKKEGEEKGH